MIGPDKAAAAGPSSILIDDRPAGLEKYAAAGGHTILFPAAQNPRSMHKDDPMDVVEHELRDMIADLASGSVPRRSG